MMETLQEVDVRPNAQAARPRRLQLRLVLLSLMGLLILGGLLFWGIRWYQYNRSHVSTDNAQIEGHLVRVAREWGDTCRRYWSKTTSRSRPVSCWS